MTEFINANPTIRKASELPTRQRRDSSLATKTKNKNSFGLLGSIIPPSIHLNDPFAPPSSSSDSDSEDDDAVEPIDEQEIYGTHVPSPNCLPSPFSPVVLRRQSYRCLFINPSITLTFPFP